MFSVCMCVRAFLFKHSLNESFGFFSCLVYGFVIAGKSRKKLVVSLSFRRGRIDPFRFYVLFRTKKTKQTITKFSGRPPVYIKWKNAATHTGEMLWIGCTNAFAFWIVSSFVFLNFQLLAFSLSFESTSNDIGQGSVCECFTALQLLSMVEFPFRLL